jgi:hypothetical protein
MHGVSEVENTKKEEGSHANSEIQTMQRGWNIGTLEHPVAQRAAPASQACPNPFDPHFHFVRNPVDTYSYQDEQAIVWLTDPNTFPFCREAITDFGRRFNQPRHDTRRIQAYAVLKPSGKRTRGRFMRRYWFLLDHDLPTGAPAEAVHRRSIMAGQPSVPLGERFDG